MYYIYDRTLLYFIPIMDTYLVNHKWIVVRPDSPRLYLVPRLSITIKAIQAHIQQLLVILEYDQSRYRPWLV
jgi:hypothetical protein